MSRDMTIDEKFYHFLNNTKSILGFKKIKFPKCKSFGEYSWQEYIEYKECKTEDEVKEFYYNVGIYSCIFYLFVTTDLHMENVIAHGKTPFFVDLESLFQVCNTINNDDDTVLNSIASVYDKKGEEISNLESTTRNLIINTIILFCFL